MQALVAIYYLDEIPLFFEEKDESLNQSEIIGFCWDSTTKVWLIWKIWRTASHTINPNAHFMFHDLFYGPKNYALLLFKLFFSTT